MSNSADQGGGIWSDGNLKITGGTLGSNDAVNGNGGGFFDDGGTASVSGCSILNNKADDTRAISSGGGIYVGGGTLTLTGSTLSGNSAGVDYGGGVVDYGGGGVDYGGGGVDYGGGGADYGGGATMAAASPVPARGAASSIPTAMCMSLIATFR